MKKYFLSLLIVFISAVPSFSQKLGRGVGVDLQLFEYKSFKNSNDIFHITGIWDTRAIDKYCIMCIPQIPQNKLSAYDQEFVFICSEGQCDSWINSLTKMKELFVRNDQIAKDNGVTSEIKKNVSEQFTFSGFCGEGIPQFQTGPIVKQYGGHGYEYAVLVIYKYQNGESLMELRIGDFYLNKSFLRWTFRSVEEFDEMINALNWDNFEQAKEEQVRKYLEQKMQQEAAAEKQKEEEALFD